ncbi:MAG: iron ABC transporter permease [Chloroflexi bacterium]|nr:iron ABC transporter permease [Chloroflexota bacterium]
MAISAARIWRSTADKVDFKIPIIGLAIAIVAYLVLIPLGMLLYGSFTTSPIGMAGTLTLDNYVTAYTNPKTYQLLKNTLIYAVGGSLLSMSLGTSLAWLCERTNMPLKGAFFVLNLLPLIFPGVISIIAWIFLLSPKIGLINLPLMALFGLKDAPFDIYSMGGMIWVESIYLAPLVFLMMGASFRSMDPSLEESATMSGSSIFSTFYRITLRLMLPALFSVMLITFIRGVESFEAPALIGIPAKIHVFTAAIFMSLRQYPVEHGLAGAYSVTVLAISAVGVWTYSKVTARAEKFSTITGKGFRPRLIDLGRWKYVACGFSILYFVVTVGLPIFVLLWSSLLKFYSVPSIEALSQISLDNYIAAFRYPKVKNAMINSTIASVGTALIVMLLTSIIAWIVVKTRTKGRWILDNMAFLPIAFPGLTLGVALMWLYLTMPIPIYGTLWVLMIAYITRFMPYGIRACSSSLIQIHKELEEASTTSGASWVQTFIRVTLPLLKPGLIGGGIYVMMFALRELSSSILLYSPGNEVLPILIFDMWTAGLHETISALGILMIIALSALFFAMQKFGRFQMTL